ncbi:GNAT family N-acetyltransferase [Cohnella terricola]|uniref:GNAT family N-acetyltransferase n=1 Tax=Cohnella terricola TaxID=1289167 RepID=UPI001645B5F4|nr:GNAT family N-acetyltransferase [Cohnella terricola]
MNTRTLEEIVVEIINKGGSSLKQLVQKDFGIIKRFNWGEKNLFITDSIIEGKKDAEVFVNENQTMILIWDKGHCIYINGDEETTNELVRVLHFLTDHLLDKEVRSQLRVLKIYFKEADESVILNSLKDFNPRILNRILYKHNLNKPFPQIFLETDIVIKEINREAILRKSPGSHQSMIEEIVNMWGSEESFLLNGFGNYATNEEGNIVSWCTSEYNSNSHCGIGIESITEYQGKGIATANTIHFLIKCLEKNIIPYWDCWKSNIPSIRVAEKTGFEKQLEYKVILINLI